MSTVRLGSRSSRRRVNQPSKAESAGGVARKHRPDYVLVILMALLLGVGAVTVYAISPGLASGNPDLASDYYSSKQITAIAMGLVAFLAAAFMPIHYWRRLTVPLLVFAVGVTIAVRLFGDQVNGAYRWLQVGGISFQAAELIKFALIVWLAGYLVDRKINQKIADNDTLKTLGAAVLVVGIVVVGLQSDLGSAAVMMAIIGLMTIVAGVPLKKVVAIGAVVLVLASLAIVVSPYRRDRVNTYLNPTADCQNEGYQACQALITVGSGGMFGKGLGRSVQAYGYLPEAANDSIFAIVAEKFGFVGSSVIIGIFVLLFKRIKEIAESATNDYSRLLVSGVLAWLSVQMIINVSAMLGLIPLKGITLPFVSYGGTSILFVMAAVGLVFQASRYTDLNAQVSRGIFSSKGHTRTSSNPYTKNRKWRSYKP